jgi:hypothetical protein
MRRDIEDALAVLDGRTRQTHKQASSRIFLTTAVRQNGALDSCAWGKDAGVAVAS